MKKLGIILVSILMLCSCARTEIPEENKINIYHVNYGKEVPELYVGVESWGNSDTAAKGGYEWNKDNGDGTMSSTIACGVHPLEMQNIQTFFTSGKEVIKLTFDESMVSYDVIRYEVEDDRWESGGYTGNEVSETVETENDSFVIEGNGKNYVYVVNVNYKNGRCEYVFGIYAGEIVVDMYKIVDGAESGNLVLAGEGNTDSAVTVLGLMAGAAFAHNFGLASSGAGPTANGKIAVIIGIVVVAAIAACNTFRKKD